MANAKSVLMFLPVLLVYVALVVLGDSDVLWTDEPTYFHYAKHLTQGYYSPRDNVMLLSGPGYPLVLAPLVYLDLPFLVLRMLNVVFMIGSMLYLYHAVLLYGNRKFALLTTFAMSLYPPFLRTVHLLMTEVFAFFLVCGFVFHLCSMHRGKANVRLHLVAACCFLGYLALTKVFFGYVVAFGLVITVGWFLWKRRKESRLDLLVFVGALVLCLPYLYYTYSLTHKVFYWSTSGGVSLYWMSSPHEKELGNWIAADTVRADPELYSLHAAFYEEISGLSQVEADERFKGKAIQNIMHHPFEFGTNWIANVGRLLFNYPFSYVPQSISTFLYMVPNMFLVVVGLLCVYPYLRRRRDVPHEIHLLIGLFAVSFFGSSLLIAYNRQFWPLIPFLVVWGGFVLSQLVTIEIKPSR